MDRRGKEKTLNLIVAYSYTTKFIPDGCNDILAGRKV